MARIIDKLRIDENMDKSLSPKVIRNKLPDEYYTLYDSGKLNNYFIEKNIGTGAGFWLDSFAENEGLATIFLTVSKSGLRSLRGFTPITELKCDNAVIKRIIVNKTYIIRKNDKREKYKNLRKDSKSNTMQAQMNYPFQNENSALNVLFIEIFDKNDPTSSLCADEFYANPSQENVKYKYAEVHVTLITIDNKRYHHKIIFEFVGDRFIINTKRKYWK